MNGRFVSGSEWEGIFDRRKLLENDTIYRVMLCAKTGLYDVICIGTECIDSGVKDSYSSIDDMPDWFSRKLAVLFTVQPFGSRPIDPRQTAEGFPMVGKPWTLKEPQIKGIGTRESEHCFWIVSD